MYAQLCKRLAEQAPNLESSDSKITTFKRLLLRQCRDEFENRTALSATYEKRIGELSGDEEEARFVAKRKMLGNIKFIGELGKLEMLHDSILHRCCEQLLVGRRKQPIGDQIEDLECLAHLIKTCGRVLDTPKAKTLVDQYFDRLRTIVANHDTPTRIKFLLQDVIELRDNRWLPRKLVTPDGPRTIQQVREDAARDGCIYLPQQDLPGGGGPGGLLKPGSESTMSSNLQEVIFSKSRPKGMEDLFGGPGIHHSTGLGVGPGVIDGDHSFTSSSNGYGGGNSNNGGGRSNNSDHGGGYHNYHHRNSGPSTPNNHHASFEEKFNNNNNSNNNGNNSNNKNGNGGGSNNGYYGGRGSTGSNSGGHYRNTNNEDDPRSQQRNNSEYSNNKNSNGGNNKPSYQSRGGDSFDTMKYGERPDFGDRFTANRNKTHPSNRGHHRGGGNNNRGGSGNYEHQPHQSMRGGGGHNNNMNSNNGYHGDRGSNNGGGMMERGGGGSSGPNSYYDNKNGGGSYASASRNIDADKELPPRFKKLGGSSTGDSGGGSGHYHHYHQQHHMPPTSFRPPSSSMMLKPKTPSSLPKSAIAKLEGGGGGSGSNVLSPGGVMMPKMSGMMAVGMMAEPPVFISKQTTNDKRRQDKNKNSNQGPTRDEVFGKIDEIVKKLVGEEQRSGAEETEENGGTDTATPITSTTIKDALAAWKEAEIPNKMVNNALIHLFKQVVKMTEESHRQLACQLVDQLCQEEAVSHVQVKETLARLIQQYSSTNETALADLARWAVVTQKIRLSEFAEMTEGGATHPLFFVLLSSLVASGALSEDALLEAYKESGVKLMDQMPADQRTDTALGAELETRKLTFLMPLLHVKGEIWRKLSGYADGGFKADEFLDWLKQTAVPVPEHHTDPAFVAALVDNIFRYVTENGGGTEEGEKALVAKFKTVFQAFLKRSGPLQLHTIYRLQVFLHERNFPKGSMLHWFMVLYEEDIIAEAMLLKWREDMNDTYPGKGKALFQVNQWLTWLEETESDDEEYEE